MELKPIPKMSMKKLLSSNPLREFSLSFRLAWQYVRRGRPWTLALTIFLMAIAFVNLVFMSSLLNGIIQGTEQQVRDNSSGEIYLAPDLKHDYISDHKQIVEKLHSLADVKKVSKQLAVYGELLADDYDVATQVKVVEPNECKDSFGLHNHIKDGDFLNGDDDGIVLGYELVAPADQRQIPQSLENTKVGDKIKLKINGIEFDVTVKGVFQTKYIEADRTALISRKTWQRFMRELADKKAETEQKIKDNSKPAEELTQILPAPIVDKLRQKADERSQDLIKEQNKVFDLFPSKDDVNLITVRSEPKKISEVKKQIEALNLQDVVVHSWHDAAGFMTSVSNSFVGIDAIMLIVGIIIAGVTIFIVIYVDVINKRRQIGIQRAIGIKPRIIVFSYVILSIFYAFCGILTGLALFFAILVPYFNAHPLSLPVTDARLVLTAEQLFLRAGIVLVASITSGLVPALLATRTKMLDAILGRG